MFTAKWKVACVSAAVCGLVGPGTALLLLEFQILRPSSFREIIATTVVALRGWIFAVVAVGPAAFVLGGVGGLLLQSLSRKYRSIKVAIASATILGLVLGGTVPVVTILVPYFFAPRDRFYSLRADIFCALPVAALTGVICEFLLLWLFLRTDRARPVGP